MKEVQRGRINNNNKNNNQTSNHTCGSFFALRKAKAIIVPFERLWLSLHLNW